MVIGWDNLSERYNENSFKDWSETAGLLGWSRSNIFFYVSSLQHQIVTKFDFEKKVFIYFSQKWGYLSPSNMSFTVPSQEMSLGYSYSQIISRLLLEAEEFVTRSNFETSQPLKHNENRFCKSPKCLMTSFLSASVSLLGHLSKAGNVSKILRSMFFSNNFNFSMNAFTIFFRVNSINLKTLNYFIHISFKKCLPNRLAFK